MIKRLTSGLPGAVYDVRLKLNVLVVGLCGLRSHTLCFFFVANSITCRPCCCNLF